MVVIEINERSVEYAEMNVRQNNLQSRISIFWNKNSSIFPVEYMKRTLKSWEMQR